MKSHPIANRFPMMSDEESASLVQSMKDHGFDPNHAIVTYEGMILDGRNRYKAALEAGVEPVFRAWPEGDPWDFVWRENAVRRHLEPSQKTAIAVDFLRGSEAWQAEREKDRAKANASRAEAAATRPRDEKGQLAPSPVSRDTPLAPLTAAHRATLAVDVLRSDPNWQEASAEAVDREHQKKQERAAGLNWERNKIAAMAGVSPATVGRVLSLPAEQFERVKQGEVSASKALGELKLINKRALAEEIRANPVVTADGRYQVIVIDPPWKYDNRAEDVSHRGKNLYPDMGIEAICALPVADKAQDDCVLWLWTTNAFMREAYQCLDAWGFKDKTILTWDKEIIGVGDWLRGQTEHCIMASRGRPVIALTNQPTIIRERRREHSRKPDAFYLLVETICPGSKLEMFARASRDGWATWGAEAEKFDAA